MRTSTLLRIIAPLALTASLAAACSSGGGDASAQTNGTGSSATAAPASAANTIVIDGFSFSTPASVKAGATVQVRNQDGTAHTVTSDDDKFDTGPVSGDGTATFVAPSEPGTYAFHCGFHSSMTGELVVT